MIQMASIAFLPLDFHSVAGTVSMSSKMAIKTRFIQKNRRISKLIFFVFAATVHKEWFSYYRRLTRESRQKSTNALIKLFLHIHYLLSLLQNFNGSAVKIWMFKLGSKVSGIWMGLTPSFQMVEDDTELGRNFWVYPPENVRIGFVRVVMNSPRVNSLEVLFFLVHRVRFTSASVQLLLSADLYRSFSILSCFKRRRVNAMTFCC